MDRTGSGGTPNPTQDVGGAAPKRRPYESPLRRQQAAQTRDRIVAAGVELVHSFPSWNWRDLTVRAVARRAGVNESTVYRYFSTERGLRDAVMRRLVEESGVDLRGLRLEDFADVIARVFAYLSSFPIKPRQTEDPTFAATDERRREALVAAVAQAAPDWSDAECRLAAAMLDMFWSVPSYERLISAWGLDPGEATRAVGWVIGLIEAAVRAGRGPGPGPDSGKAAETGAEG